MKHLRMRTNNMGHPPTFPQLADATERKQGVLLEAQVWMLPWSGRCILHSRGEHRLGAFAATNRSSKLIHIEHVGARGGSRVILLLIRHSRLIEYK